MLVTTEIVNPVGLGVPNNSSEQYDADQIAASILLSTKKALGIPPEETAFDPDILLHLNSVFAELSQLGVGPETTFEVQSEDTLWEEFTANRDLAMVKSYVYLEVRLMFDPPTASLLSSLERRRDEYEWRLNVAGDSPLYRNEDRDGLDN
jgi:hypothetical protein